MEPAFLVPETTVHANGESASTAIPLPRPDALMITLGITKIVEQEALQLAIEGSADGSTWSAVPLASFPQKFYTGVSTLLIDLKRHPDTAYLKAHWKVSRWGRGDKVASFTFYVFAEPSQVLTAG
jgi:hypothetical protein